LNGGSLNQGKAMWVKHRAKSLFSGLAAVATFAVLTVPAGAQDTDAQVQSCAACHGQNGVPADPKTTPIIWGQTEYYIVTQLRSYKTGDRKNPVMEAIAKSIKTEDMRPIARYFAGKTWPENQAKNASATEPNGMAVCKICHQQNFHGALPGPRLAGLSYEYLSAQMRLFANDQRTTNEDMTKIMKGVPESDREAMAHYLAGL
jgi:cytochrome c553